jgi:methylase of polypeptide subunit release factors
MLEIGYKQGRAVKQILEHANCFSKITIEKDFQGNERIAIAKR